jgi:hypothetical protein
MFRRNLDCSQIHWTGVSLSCQWLQEWFDSYRGVVVIIMRHSGTRGCYKQVPGGYVWRISEIEPGRRWSKQMSRINCMSMRAADASGEPLVRVNVHVKQSKLAKSALSRIGRVRSRVLAPASPPHANVINPGQHRFWTIHFNIA